MFRKRESFYGLVDHRLFTFGGLRQRKKELFHFPFRSWLDLVFREPSDTNLRTRNKVFVTRDSTPFAESYFTKGRQTQEKVVSFRNNPHLRSYHVKLLVVTLSQVHFGKLSIERKVITSVNIVTENVSGKVWKYLFLFFGKVVRL